MTKLEKVISGLRHCERISCNNCPYAGQDEDGRSPYKTCKQLEMLGDALAMLKDPDRLKVVRCGGCRFWKPGNAEEGDSSGKCRRYFGMCENATTDAMCFCSEGERE